MAAKKLPETPDELKGLAAKFFETIKAESDRGYVLVAASFLDEALEILLRSRMITDPVFLKKSIQPLFVGMGPLRSFWAKTELCRALDLLSEQEHSDLGQIRNLRNHFAHSYVDASFADRKAVDLVSELWHFGTKQIPLTDEEKSKPDFVRHRFGLAAAWLAGTFHKRAGMAGDERSDPNA